MILTHLALGESVSITEGLAAVCSFIGAALVARSPGSAAGGALVTASDPRRSHTLGVAAALLAALASAISITVVRRLHTSVHFFFNVFSVGVCGTVLATLVILAGKSFSRPVRIGLATKPVPAALLVLRGSFGFAGQCALSKSLQHCRAVSVILRNINVVLAYLLGVLFLDEIPSAAGCLGAAMVLAAAIAVTVPQAQLAQEHR
jgi:drug/metabolite transporter (DMT)-like permease